MFHTVAFRHRIRPADRHRLSQHRRFSERDADRHQYDRRKTRSRRPISGRSISSTTLRPRTLATASPRRTPTANIGLYVQSGYVRDTVEITRGLQLIAGARFDQFDMSAVDLNTGIQRRRVDDKVSPQAAVIIKPIDTMCRSTRAYSISYLPASGDQFSSLTDGTLILAAAEIREHRNRREVEHQSETAVLDGGLQSEPHQPADRRRQQSRLLPAAPAAPWPAASRPASPVTSPIDWQSPLGYAYTDARITSPLVGARWCPAIGSSSCPYNQFAWWNRYQFNADVGCRPRRDLFRRFLYVVRRYRADCRASFASIPRSM